MKWRQMFRELTFKLLPVALPMLLESLLSALAEHTDSKESTTTEGNSDSKEATNRAQPSTSAKGQTTLSGASTQKG